MPAPTIPDHPAARRQGEAVSLPSDSASGQPKPKKKCNYQAVEALLLQQKTVVEIIARVQSEFIATADKQATWNGLLDDILRITGSEYGLIGQVLRSDQGQPYLKAFSLTDIAWNAETRALYQAQAGQGFEFHNLNN